MLTLILLVVLGGGAGLLAVSLVDSGGLSRLVRSRGASLRASRGGHTAAAEPTGEHDDRPLLVVEPEVSEPPPTATSPVRRRPARSVPAAFTAIEGTYREVARPPWWRRLVSLLSLAVILVVMGVVIAALAGAIMGGAAELIDGAIG